MDVRWDCRTMADRFDPLSDNAVSQPLSANWPMSGSPTKWGTCEESRHRHALPPPPPVEQPGRTIEVRHEPDVHLNPIDRGEETLSIRVQAEAAIEKLGGHIAEVKGCRHRS